MDKTESATHGLTVSVNGEVKEIAFQPDEKLAAVLSRAARASGIKTYKVAIQKNGSQEVVSVNKADIQDLNAGDVMRVDLRTYDEAGC
jgi:FtsP/CotA-like multicopper oxidase with cupredoxin domain